MAEQPPKKEQTKNTMSNIHHKRSNYENLYRKLSKELGVSEYGTLKHFSDYRLLHEINIRLAKLNCVLLNREELEMELV